MSTKTKEDKLSEKLFNGIAIFHYRKKDGTIRGAAGTTNPNIIPNGDMTSTSMSHVKGNVQSYYDLSRSKWRNFIRTNVLSIRASVNWEQGK